MTATVAVDAPPDPRAPAAVEPDTKSDTGSGAAGATGATGDGDAGPEAVPQLSARRRTMVLAAMCLALVLVVAGVTMLVNALSRISADLDLSQTTQTWVVDAYALPFAALLMIAGALGDRYGRRGALLAGTALFGLGSLLSAMAGAGGELLACRAITGVGAALIMPGTLSTITSVFPAEQRARAVGIWSGFAMAGGTLGMLGSGLLLERFWWGSVFVVAAGLASLAFVAIAAAVPSTRSSRPVGLDPLGTVLSAVGIGALVLGIIEGPEQGWTSPVTVVGLAVAVGALVGFVLWELRAREPLLDPRLFKLPGFGTGAAGLFVMFMAMFGFFLVAMQFLQEILGYSPLKAAVALLPQMVLMMPLAAIAAPLSLRVGQRRLCSLGLLVSAVGMLWFVTLDAGSSYWEFLFGMLVLSVGMGLAMTPATTAIVGSLPLAKQGVASAVNDTAREVGGALGVAVLGSAFNTAYRGRITGHLDGLPADVAEGARQGPAIAFERAHDLGGRAGADLTTVAQHAFESGLRAAVLISAALFALGALYTWWKGPSPANTADSSRKTDALDPVPG
jgi:EmrB/QacA subfamily drug resistance transporter